MTKSNEKNVVHESEVQRQFVRVPLPAQVLFDGKEYDVHNLSSGGLSLEGVSKPYPAGLRVPLRLSLPFQSFSLEINIDGEVKYFNDKKSVVGCQFVNVSAEQVSLLNHVIKSFMAGEIVKSGDLLNAAARDNFVNPRKKASTEVVPTVNVRRQIPGLLIVGVLGIVAAGFIVANIYDSVFRIRSSDAVVQGAEIQVRAVSQGVFVSKLSPTASKVEDRQELGTVNGDDLKSPCKCLITQIHRQDGEFVIAGDPIVSLVPVDSVPWVVATLKPSEASRLSLNNPVKIAIAGTNIEVAGHVASIKSDLANTNEALMGYSSRMVQVRIVADQKLPIDLAGRPAKVVFEMN